MFAAHQNFAAVALLLAAASLAAPGRASAQFADDDLDALEQAVANLPPVAPSTQLPGGGAAGFPAPFSGAMPPGVAMPQAPSVRPQPGGPEMFGGAAPAQPQQFPGPQSFGPQVHVPQSPAQQCAGLRYDVPPPVGPSPYPSGYHGPGGNVPPPSDDPALIDPEPFALENLIGPPVDPNTNLPYADPNSPAPPLDAPRGP